MCDFQQQLGGLADGCWQTGDTRPIPLALLCVLVLRHYRSENVRLAVPALSPNLDPGSLQRVLHHLIDNALEHGSSPVLIGAQLVPGAVVVCDQRSALPAVNAPLAPGSSAGGLGYAITFDFCSSHGERRELEPQAGGAVVAQQLLP